MSTVSQDILDSNLAEKVEPGQNNTQEQQLLDDLSKGIIYYKKRTNTLSAIILTLTIILLLLALVVAYLLTNKVRPIYFAQKPDLTITELIPLSQPYLADSEVAQWAADCGRTTFNLDFSHLKEDLARGRACFKPDAFGKLLSAMEREGIINLIKTEHLNTEMTITTPAIVTKKGVVDGITAWIVEYKFILSFFSSQGLSNTQKMIAQITIQRADTLEHPKGVSIRQMIVSPE